MGGLSGVRSIHECLCLHARTVFVPLAQCLTWIAGACLSLHVVLVHVQFCGMKSQGKCTYRARVRELARCTCTCTAFSVDSRGDAPLAQCFDMDSPGVFGLVRCTLCTYRFVAWTARAMHLSCSRA